MLARVTRSLALAALAALALGADARAGRFDLIYSSRIDVTTYPFNSGFSTGNTIALLVNTGPAAITGSELDGARFEVESSNPDVYFTVNLLNVGPPASPIQPQEAVGTSPSAPMIALMLPGESLRDVFPRGLFWLAAGYPVAHTGTAVVMVTMTMGAEVARFMVTVNFTSGSELAITYPEAARVSSVPLATPVRNSTWGAIKGLYR